MKEGIAKLASRPKFDDFTAGLEKFCVEWSFAIPSKLLFFFFCLATGLLGAYRDEELEQLWSRLSDITHPTLEDYQSIDSYLREGRRPYLDALRNSEYVDFYRGRLKSILNFRLVSPENKMPVFEKYAFHLNEDTKSRCIILYSSSNGIYPKKARKLIQEIEDCGYSGNLCVRIGGFPNTESGGLKICHVPYSFKVAFLKEAKEMGFKEVLWIDLAIHPMSDFETVFWEIEQRGYFFTAIGLLQDNFCSHLQEAANALGIGPHLYGEIPHISSSMIGLNMENRQALQLLESWYWETENVYPNMTWWPEELSLSVAAWRLGCQPFVSFGDLVCTEGEQFELQKRPTIQFYLDAWR